MPRLAAACIFLFIIRFSTVVAQDSTQASKRNHTRRFYFYWGWNRGWYSESDIHFKGNGYSFTLSDVEAHDNQSQILAETYANPSKVTIPQTVLRIGYYLYPHWNISFGADHMKYVMTQDQTVTINGSISETNTEYNGVYTDDQINLTKDFLIFEHTDGLNYLNLELRRTDELLDFSPRHKGRFTLNLTEGIGAGVLFPRTNTTLLGKERYDEFHVAGYGVSAVAGLNLTLWKYVFIQTETKFGYINMPDIRTTHSKSDSASQHFTFFQYNFSLGFYFYL